MKETWRAWGKGIGWYDRKGKLIPGTTADMSSPQWEAAMRRVERLLHDDAYRIVGRTERGRVCVSTIWLGLNHHPLPSGVGRPVIFETMVFVDGKFGDEMDRYCTEAEALAGHEAMCAKVFKGRKK